MNIRPLFSAKWLLGLILCSFGASLFAQKGHDPIFDIAKNKPVNNRYFKPGISGNSPNITQQTFFGAYTVPVVVHIISQNPDAITDQQIIDAIKDLNDAFAHTGVYGTGPGANTGITFCLAKIDPDGGITNGITRTKSVLGDFDADIENDALKNLVSWDTKQYCNIWLVDGVESEIMTTFSCGSWTRRHEDGYAGLSGDGDYRDGIVVVGFGNLWAHEMGHYLGLAHTFIIGNCTNNNCALDGDGICDTPPQSVVGGSCISPQNSCTNDTTSGFTKDVPDLNSNFMSYSGACANEFTAGQAAKMRNVLTTVRNSLTAQNKCSPPCGENIMAKFTRDNWQPAAGSNINFTSTSTGGTNYEWSVDGVVSGTNSPSYAKIFPVAGKYKVTLKVYNANQNCFASYSDFIIVNCGVMARFTPDKRLIAAKDPYLVDSIFFTNKSVGATSYKWLLSNDQGMAEQVASTAVNLNYIFKIPANYAIRLVASGGACNDTTEKFNFTVQDATPDGALRISSVECYQQTKIKFSFYACNYGNAPFLPNIPVSFYDGDPRTANARKLGTFLIPDTIKGQCCGILYDTILDVHQTGINHLYLVFNDNGNIIPVSLPNTGQIEKTYANNVEGVDSFQFRVSITPPMATISAGDTLQLVATAGPGNVASIVWTTPENLTCTNCSNPLFVAAAKATTKRNVVATSSNGCIDSASVDIKVLSADDYTIAINSITCSQHDSLRCNFTICNNFKTGIIPKDLKVAFYDADPSTSTAHLLGPVFITDASAPTKCATYEHLIKSSAATKIFAVVNDNGINIPVQLPEDSIILEKDYTNNTASLMYQPDTATLQPVDTAVSLNQSVSFFITSPVYDASTIRWLPGDGYTLSCTECSSTSVTVNTSSTVRMEMLNQYGCTISGEAKIKVIQPDMTIQVIQTNCFTNDSLLVKFKICMNNDYDSVLKNVPVAFYDGSPAASAKLLEPVFFTSKAMAGNCDTFSVIIKSPSTQNLVAVVNDKGDGNAVFDETNFENNTDAKNIIPFAVNIHPDDTTIFRSTNIQLIAETVGGDAGTFNWEPSQFLSCSNCATPVATPPYSLQFKLDVKNEYSCTATAYASIKTFTGGKVNIPNGFTPNADGRNDVFYILGSNDIRILKDFSIFNRWGQKVFQVINAPANDPGFGWNGFVDGKLADAGTYVYFVNISFTNGTEQLYKGTVTLIR